MTVSDPDVLDKDENTSMKSDEDNPDKDIEKSGDYGSIDVLDKNQETSADPDPEASADPDPEVPKNELSPLISTHDDGNDDGKVSPEDSAELAFSGIVDASSHKNFIPLHRPYARDRIHWYHVCLPL